MSTSLLDELRVREPALGFALYAYTPGGRVTFEAITPDGETFKWEAETAAEAVALAFPNTSKSEPRVSGLTDDPPAPTDIFE